MAAHVAVSSTAPARILAVLADPLASLLPVLSAAWVSLRPKLLAAWREWRLSLLAGSISVAVGLGVLTAGFLLDDAGLHFAAMALVCGLFLAAAFSVAWMLAGES
jgi:predicted MFS family arabinose efflux permease